MDFLDDDLLQTGIETQLKRWASKETLFFTAIQKSDYRRTVNNMLGKRDRGVIKPSPIWIFFHQNNGTIVMIHNQPILTQRSVQRGNFKLEPKGIGKLVTQIIKNKPDSRKLITLGGYRPV